MMRYLTQSASKRLRPLAPLTLAAAGILLAVAPTTVNAGDPPPGGGGPGGRGGRGGRGGPISYQGITPTYANLAYAPASPREVLDLFLPSGAGPFPVIVFIHGGAFLFGGKEMLPTAPAQAFLQAGYAIASINYRLAGEATFPAAVEDAKVAIRFLRANASAYKLDATTIVAWGQSAGAHIAQMLGTSAGVAALEGAHLGNATYSSRVQAVINQYGPTDFALMDAQLAAQGCPASALTHNQADSPESRYLGAALPTVPHLVQQANPLTYLSAQSAPTLVEKGSEDCIVPVHQSALLHDALAEAGVRTEYVLLQGAGHGGPEFDAPANIERMRAFLTAVVP